MASKFIQVRLNQQSVQGMKQKLGGNTPSMRERSDSIGSQSDSHIVEYSYQDTFTTLLEKCLVALNIHQRDSSSTKLSNDDQGSNSRSTVTKQALIYDKEHNLVTMLQEVKENETYFIEIIDNQIIAINHLGSPMLPPSLENQDSVGSDRGGSFNNFNSQQSRRSSLAGHRSSFASSVIGNMGAARDSTLLSCDTDFVDPRSKSDITMLSGYATRQTSFKVALVGQQQSGKTSLAYRFVDRTSFLDEYEPTIVDTYEQEMNMIDPSDGLNRVVNLTIKDIGHATLKEQMLCDADAVLFCYDVTNEESFFALSSLFQLKMQMEYSTMDDDTEDYSMQSAMDTLSQHQNGAVNDASSQQPKLRPVVLVGCKSDLSAERQVDYLDGERTAESFQAPYIECSANNNHRVEDVFELVLIQLFKQEKGERDKKMHAQNKQMMLSGTSISNKKGMMRHQDDSCCTIF